MRARVAALWRGPAGRVGSAAVAKVLVMGVSGLLGLFTTRLIISSFGTEAYAQYGLLIALTSLIPFADLGVAAVVINAVAASDDPKNDPVVQRTITTALRLLLLSGTVILAAVAALTLMGAWPALLGPGLMAGGGGVVLVCAVVFCAALPLAIAPRILVGLNMTTSQIATQAVVSPFVFTCVAVSAAVGGAVGPYVAVFSYVGNALVLVLCAVIVIRMMWPLLRDAFRDIPSYRSKPGVPVAKTAWPMVAQMLALPVAMQTDRIILSHLGTSDDLAQYNLASQLFALVLQTIATAGVALWPLFARARGTGTVVSPAKAVVWFLAGGLAAGLALAALSPLIAGFVSDGKITLDWWLVGGFVVFVALQAAKYPLGMYMTDERGLLFQVWPILAMVPISVGLSIWLTTLIGAGGPVIGTVVAVALCQVLPNLLWVRRDLRERRKGSEL